jgi:hypothetical protein
MPSPWDQALHNLRDRLDEDLLPGLYTLASLPTATLRAELVAAGLPFVDDEKIEQPSAEALEAAGRQLVEEAAEQASLRGGLGAAFGLLGIPPEVVAALVMNLRLAQRLAVLYGHDPETDAGKLLLLRAFATSLHLELPPQGQLALRVHELRSLTQAPIQVIDRAPLAEALALRAVVSLARRLTAVIPVIGAGLGAWAARRSLRERGERMRQVLARASEAPLRLTGPAEEALELPSPGGRTSAPR